MTSITIQTNLTQDEVERAISHFLRERERVRLQSQRRRERIRQSKPPKEPKEEKPKRSYYQPTGRPRGRPRKIQSASGLQPPVSGQIINLE